MNKIFNKLFIAILLVLLIKVPVVAFEINNYQDFSSRSLIIPKKTNSLTQEQRDLLISKKLAPNVRILLREIKANNIENVQLLLDCKVDPNYNYMTEYPIYIAAKTNNFEILKLLYSYDAKFDRGFYSELYEAIKNKNNDMANFLIDNGANINYKDSVTDNTILYLAIKNNMNDVVKKLIKNNAKIDIKSTKLIRKKKLYDLIDETK